MKDGDFEEKRKFMRYDTDVKIQFYVSFDIHTKIDFQILDESGKGSNAKKYPAVSRNVNAEGLAFRSGKQLSKGDRLVLFVRVPKSDKAIRMEGEVRWCHAVGNGRHYDTGIRVKEVEGNSVEKSIVYDTEHQIAWSIVLDSVFGSFKHALLKPQISKSNKDPD